MAGLIAVLVALGVLIGAIYVLVRPYWAAVMVMAMYPIEQLLQSTFAFLRTTGWIINALVGGLVIFSVGTSFMRQRPIFSSYANPVSLTLLTFYILIWLGVLWAPDRERALALVTKGIPYWILLAALLPLLIIDLRDFQRLLVGYLMIGTTVAVLVLMSPNTEWVGARMRVDLGMNMAGKVYSNPLALGTLGGYLAIAAALIQPARHSIPMWILRGTAFLCGFGLSVASGSRGQVLGVMLTAVVFLPMSRKMANTKQFFMMLVAFGVIVLGTYTVFGMFVSEQNEMRWNVENLQEGAASRLHHVLELSEAWITSPTHWLFGLGTNAYPSVSQTRAIPYVHNILVESYAEFGIVGFALFSAMLFLTARYAYRMWNANRDDPQLRSVVAILSALCFYGLFLGLKQGNNVSNPAPYHWWLVLAKVACTEFSWAMAARQEEEGAYADEEEDWEDDYESYGDEYEDEYVDPVGA